jgi:hypothetical protein
MTCISCIQSSNTIVFTKFLAIYFASKQPGGRCIFNGRFAMRFPTILLLGTLAFYGGPPVIENASGQCEAVAHRISALDPETQHKPLWQLASAIGADTFLIAHLAQTKFKAIPSSLTCSYEYWVLLMHPDMAPDLIPPAS